MLVLLLLDKSSTYYERCIKQTPPIKFSILINDKNLRKLYLQEIDFSKRTVLIEQRLVVCGTPCLSFPVSFSRSVDTACNSCLFLKKYVLRPKNSAFQPSKHKF